MLFTSVGIGALSTACKPYPRQPDGSRLDVEVHEVVNHPTLQVVLDAIDNDLLADVHDLQIGQMALVLINGLVHLLVIPDALYEVRRSTFRVLALVVGGRGLDLEDVAHDQGLVVTFRLDEERLHPLGITPLLDPASALLGGVGRVEDPNDPSVGEPIQHIRHRRFGRRPAHSFALLIRGVEEIGAGLGGVLPSVVAHVEDHRIDGEPLQVALSCADGVSQEHATI